VNATPESTGTLADAIEHGARLLDQDPKLAEEQAGAILEVSPNHPPALLLLAAAQRRQGNNTAALAVLEPLAQTQSAWATAQYELGLALTEAGRGDEAIAALSKTVKLKPQHPDAWRRLMYLWILG